MRYSRRRRTLLQSDADVSVYESTTPRGGGVVVAAALIAAVTVTGLFTRPLLAIDETRYAAVALDMFQRGDWLVPHLNGEAYSHKPPLLFWLVMLGWKAFGVSTVWARLVGPLAGITAVSLVAALARALWPQDARARGWAPLITAGALLWAAFGALLMFDTLLACGALLALLGVVHAVEHDRRRGLAYLSIGITIGILAKGPVILLHVLPVALAAPWWATPRENRHWSRWYVTLLSGVLLGAAGALLWAIPAGIAGGAEYQQSIFFGQTAGRITKSFAHRRPFYWYLPILPALLFPWFAWPESWRAMRALRAAPRDTGVRFTLVWAGAGLLAFSLVSGKQVHYLLPLIPACALLLARGLSQREAAPLTRPWIVALISAAVAASVLLAGTTTLAAKIVWWPHDAMAWWWTVLPIGASVMLVVWQRGWITRNAAVHALSVSTAVLLVGIQLAAGRAGTVPYDTTAMATVVKHAVSEGHPIAMIGAYNGEYHYEGRLQNARIDVITDADVPAWMQAHASGLLLRYDPGRVAPVLSGVVAQHAFRNGWATLFSAMPTPRAANGDAGVHP
jgi:4-amino-4-deoxy-L-arabinose transferase-like glycosyltransferase